MTTMERNETLKKLILWLIAECREHNGDYSHITSEERLKEIEEMLARLDEPIPTSYVNE